MTPSDMADVLTAAGVYDGRKISPADVAAWHAAIGQYDREDAIAGVVRHYADSTEWLKPGHLKAQIQAIRNERAARLHPEALALPSRFEADPQRDQRLAAGVQQLAERWSVPDTEPSDAHSNALARARRERGNRPLPTTLGMRKRATAREVTTAPPSWTEPAVAEQTAAKALHDAGRACGRSACPRCHQNTTELRRSA